MKTLLSLIAATTVLAGPAAAGGMAYLEEQGHFAAQIAAAESAAHESRERAEKIGAGLSMSELYEGVCQSDDTTIGGQAVLQKVLKRQLVRRFQERLALGERPKADRDGVTLMHHAAHDLRYDEGGDPCHELVAVMAKAGVSLNAKDGSGDTPLHWAAEREYAYDFLKKLGANENVKDKHGVTAKQARAKAIEASEAEAARQEATPCHPSIVRPCLSGY